MADRDQECIKVEVAFALPDRQALIELTVPIGTTAREAVDLCAIQERFPDLTASTFREAPLGIFGKRLRDPERHALRAGDRVEIYRPLTIDPKEARKRRASGRRP